MSIEDIEDVENMHFQQMQSRTGQLKMYCYDMYFKTNNIEWMFATQSAVVFAGAFFGAVREVIALYSAKIYIEYIERKLTGPPYRYTVINNLFRLDKKLFKEILLQYAELGPVDVLTNNVAKLLLKEKPIRLERLDPSKGKNTKFSIHSISQFYDHPKQLQIFTEEALSIARENSIQHRESREMPTNFGVVLNVAQKRVFEGIVKAFSDTNYKGDELIDKKSYYSRTKVHLNKAPYKNIDSIPVIKLKQSEIINLAGYSGSQGDTTDVVEAIKHLATKQFCFYWNRLAQDEKGKPKKDKRGDYVKEDIMEIGTLLRIKEIRVEGRLEYYEIEPSAAMLDQLNSYFLLVPSEWRQEVKSLTGKRVSSYTYEFLMWLRLQYESIRRHNSTGGTNRKNKPFIISLAWEDIAIRLKIPESIYKRKKERSIKIREEAYSVAKELGYILKYENTGAVDVLYLNEKYYPTPGKLN